MNTGPTAKRHQPFRVPLRGPRRRLPSGTRPRPLPPAAIDIERVSVTVCAAALFSWVYDAEKNDYGLGIIAFSDRMLTDEGLGIQYQGGKWKASILNKGHMILVSGPFVVHSELMRRLLEPFRATAGGDGTAFPDPTTYELAQLYAGHMRDYRNEQASHLYLSPLSLDHEAFLSRQRTLDPALVSDLANQLQNHKIEGNPEAIIIGCEGSIGHLYRVDCDGLVTCHDDIGFVSIGNGGIHASGHFMLERHHQQIWYYQALMTAFAAKRRAEVAPGVGDETDMFLVLRDRVDKLPDALIEEMKRLFNERRDAARNANHQDAVRLGEFDVKAHQQQPAPPISDAETPSEAEPSSV